MNWIKQNIEWIFSGVGVFIIGLIINWLSKKSNSKKQSINIKAGKDVNYVGRDNYTIEQLTINFAKPINPDEKVSLVDISISQSNEFPILDIKILNNTENTIFFKEIELEIIDKWIIHQEIMPKKVPVSWVYDIVLPENKYQKTVGKISQEISAKTTDRFGLKLKGVSNTTFGLTLYLFKIKLIYNEDNKFLISPLMLTNIPEEVEIHGSFNPGISNELLTKNNQTAKDIIQLVQKSDVLVDTNIKDAILSWANAI